MAQNAPIDSLKKVIATEKDASEKLWSMVKLTNELIRYDPVQAKNNVILTLKLSSKLNNTVALSASYAQLCSIFYNGGEMDSAKVCLDKLKGFAELTAMPSVDEYKLKGNYYATAGLYFKSLGNYKAALSFMIKGNNLGQVTQNAAFNAGQLLNIGNTYIKLADYKSAMNYHLKSLDAFLKINNQKGISFCYQAIALDFTELHLYRQALPYALKAQLIKTSLEDKKGRISAENSLGTIYRGLHLNSEALLHFKRSLNMVEQMGSVADEGPGLLDIAETYLVMNQPDSAGIYYNKARIVFQKENNNSKVDLIDGKLNLLHVGVFKKRTLENVLNEISVYKERGDKLSEINSYKFLAKLYKEKKDYAKALAASDYYYTELNKVENASLSLQLKKLEGQFTSKLKEKEIALLKKDKKISGINLEKEKTLKIFIISTSLLTILLVILFAYRKRTVDNAKSIIEMDKIRVAIARDLHDDIGSRLTNIQFMTEMVRNSDKGLNLKRDFVSEIHEQILASTEALDEIVWNMKTNPNEKDSLPVRMRRYACDIFDTQNIDYSLNIEDEFDEIIISHEKQRDIFLMYKEILNNICKHAATSNVVVDVRLDKNNIYMGICDNGKGFDLTKVDDTRSGLCNLKSRVDKWRGTFDLTSAVGNGTTIKMTIPRERNLVNELISNFKRTKASA